MPDKTASDLDLKTKHRTAATVYLVVAGGVIIGVVAVWMYLFSG